MSDVDIEGIHMSDDAGATWRSPITGLEVGYLRSVAIDPGQPDGALVAHGRTAVPLSCGSSWERCRRCFLPKHHACRPWHSRTAHFVAGSIVVRAAHRVAVTFFSDGMDSSRLLRGIIAVNR